MRHDNEIPQIAIPHVSYGMTWRRPSIAGEQGTAIPLPSPPSLSLSSLLLLDLSRRTERRECGLSAFGRLHICICINSYVVIHGKSDTNPSRTEKVILSPDGGFLLLSLSLFPPVFSHL